MQDCNILRKTHYRFSKTCSQQHNYSLFSPNSLQGVNGISSKLQLNLMEHMIGQLGISNKSTFIFFFLKFWSKRPDLSTTVGEYICLIWLLVSHISWMLKSLLFHRCIFQNIAAIWGVKRGKREQGSLNYFVSKCFFGGL